MFFLTLFSPVTKVSFYTVGRLHAGKSTQFHSGRKQTLLVPDIRIFSGEMHPGDVYFYLLDTKGKSGDHPTQRSLMMSKMNTGVPSRRDGILGIISNVLVFPPATPVWCLQMQPVTFHGKENWMTSKSSLNTHILWIQTLQSV